MGSSELSGTNQAFEGTTAEWRRRHFRRSALRERSIRSGGVAIDFPDGSPIDFAPSRLGDEQRRTGELLERLLDGSGVPILHGRRIPGTGTVVDHIAIGPTGISLIQTGDRSGAARVRRRRLMVGGEDQTGLVAGVVDQLALVRPLLEDARLGWVPLHGALCCMGFEAPPILGRLRVSNVTVEGPRPLARMLRSQGPLSDDEVGPVADSVARCLPPV